MKADIFGKIEDRNLVLLICLLIIFLIALTDYYTGTEFSSTIFYLIPIALIAIYRNTKVYGILVCSFVASSLWFTVEYVTNEHSSAFFPIWNAVMKMVIFTATGLLLYYLKEKQSKLRSVNNYLLASNENKNTFIGIAVHDLRNPISGIYSLSDLLLSNKDKLDPEIAEGLGFIKSLSSNSLTIIQDLLNISKLESGKIELKIKSDDYISFVRKQIGINRIIAKHKNITIDFESAVSALRAEFDSSYMSEVIDNLLSNAIKYSEPESKVIVKVSLEEGDQVLTEVIDNGRGIAEEEQKKLFRYFQTTSTQPTSGEQSTGLGLAIAKQIITLHHGNVGVNSAPGKGSRFYYTFPQTRNIG